jgi:RNA polymerase sigma-70 factor (ECF subfamily)
MSPPELHTTSLLRLVERFRAGDPTAFDELLARAGERLARLTSAMLRRFPDVRAREGSSDVLQGALLRLHRALRDVTPPSTAAYFGLAAAQVRRELLDLSRRHRGPGAPLPTAGRPDPPAADADLGRWADLHEAADALPERERAVFDLLFYQGLSAEEAAELLGVSARTVRRWWQSACLLLNERLGGDLPSA